MVALYGYFACRPSSPLNWNEIALRRKNYQQIIEKTAQTVELESVLIKAVIHAESNFNPLALSRKGAMGLMQLMTATAKNWVLPMLLFLSKISMQEVDTLPKFLSNLMVTCTRDCCL